MTLSPRPERPEDRDFLRALFGETRAEFVAHAPCDEAQAAVLVDMQFEAQTRHYEMARPDAERFILLAGEIPVGRLWIDRGADEIHLLEIALMPSQRGHGHGGAVIRTILDEATARRVPVRCSVERGNPAQRLYARLGFRRVGDDDGPFDHLEWRRI